MKEEGSPERLSLGDAHWRRLTMAPESMPVS